MTQKKQRREAKEKEEEENEKTENKEKKEKKDAAILVQVLLVQVLHLGVKVPNENANLVTTCAPHPLCKLRHNHHPLC